MKEFLRKNYKMGNDIFGLPQEYKGIKLYPIKLKDLNYQEIFYSTFTHPKSYIPNKEVLKSSYLKFFIYVVIPNMNTDSEMIFKEFMHLLNYITHEEDIDLIPVRKDGEGLDSIDLFIQFGDIKLNEKDFDNMREIILEQNGLSIEYIEEYRPDLEKKLNFVNRGEDNLTLKDRIFTFCSLMRIDVNHLVDYTILQFNDHFEKLINLKEFDLYKPLLVSGQIELKNGEIKHYLYHSKKSGRYEGILTSMEDFKNSEAFKALQNLK